MALQITLPHAAQHVNFLKSDETMVAQYKQVWPRLSNVASVTKGIIAQLTREAAAQQQQQAMQQPQGAPDQSQDQPTQPPQ